jgi:hypothetical protein
VTVSDAFFMGLTYIGFDSCRLHYSILAGLSSGASLLLLCCLLCLNKLCRASCLWLINNARVRITIGTEDKRKWNMGGHDVVQVGTADLFFPFHSPRARSRDLDKVDGVHVFRIME